MGKCKIEIDTKNNFNEDINESDDTITGFRLTFDDKLSHWVPNLACPSQWLWKKLTNINLFSVFLGGNGNRSSEMVHIVRIR